MAEFRAQQMRDMNVVATLEGVLQELPLEEGQWIEPGAVIAKVVQPHKLKAEIRVPQNQAREIVLGQPAEIDIRGDVVAGKVVRIDPGVQAGSVIVDVALSGELPRGARLDMTVEGRIQIDHLEDALFVERPAMAQAHGESSIFRLHARDTEAVRAAVLYGRASARSIQILEGLAEGDRVVLGDMSRWHDTDRLRVE